MQIFLKLKHWQLFLLLFIIPFVLQIGIMVSTILHQNHLFVLGFFPVVMISFIGVLMAWLYTLGINLHKKLPDTVKMNITRFKIFLFFPVVYMLLICVGIFIGMNAINMNQVKPDKTQAIYIMIGFVCIVPIHLFAMFCMLYVLYFVAKCLKSIELQRRVSFSDYAGEFVLLWLFYIGVWIIQPRINQLFEEQITA